MSNKFLNYTLDLNTYNGTSATILENEYVEYKVSMSEGISKNIQEAICAFLNRNGGYIIVGVANDLKIVGVDISMYDKFVINCIDSIYHQSVIISGEEGATLDSFLIEHFLHETTQGKLLCVIKVFTDLPLITRGARSHYRIKTGQSYFRLTASNLKNPNMHRLYTFAEVESTKISVSQSKELKLRKEMDIIKKYAEQVNRNNSDLEVEKELLEIVNSKNNSVIYNLIKSQLENNRLMEEIGDKISSFNKKQEEKQEEKMSVNIGWFCTC